MSPGPAARVLMGISPQASEVAVARRDRPDSRIAIAAARAAGPGTGHGRIDPVRAVTAILPAEEPARKDGGNPVHAALIRAAPAGPGSGTVTLAVILGSFGLMTGVVTAVLVIPAARRRRPGPGPGIGTATGPG